MQYRTIHVVRHWLPDDRLVYAQVSDDGVMEFWYRAWRIHPELVREMDELSRAVAYSGLLELDPTRVGWEPRFSAWFERVTGDDWMPWELMRYRVGDCSRGEPFFEIQVRAALADPLLIRELNEEALPSVCGALVPALSAPV